jgi:hypothetical protein
MIVSFVHQADKSVVVSVHEQLAYFARKYFEGRSYVRQVLGVSSPEQCPTEFNKLTVGQSKSI